MIPAYLAIKHEPNFIKPGILNLIYLHAVSAHLLHGHSQRGCRSSSHTWALLLDGAHMLHYHQKTSVIQWLFRGMKVCSVRNESLWGNWHSCFARRGLFCYGVGGKLNNMTTTIFWLGRSDHGRGCLLCSLQAITEVVKVERIISLRVMALGSLLGM